MINGNVHDFVNNLYYGTEMFFEFDGNTYFIQGRYDRGLHHLVLDYATKSNGYVWEYSSKDSTKCVKKFLNAHLWNGKKFNDLEKEMTWLKPI